MPIITINRGSYSRGKAVAEKLASKLGYACVSRDVLLEASDEFNIPEIKLIRALHDAPSILERFTHGKERFISYLYSALLQHARKDNIVYHGLAGQFFLRDISHVFKVRIIADIQDRVKEEMRRENISADKALYILKKDDEERRKWALQLYGTDTCDSKLYDMVLHIRTLTVDDAVDILFSIAQKPAFQATAESRQQVEDLALSAKVKADLAIFAPKIQIRSDNGKVFVSCIENIPESEWARIKSVVSQVEGVKEVTSNLHVSKEQHDHINPFHNIG
ncbi:MAG: cytidylate kinase family protein [Desulfatitalea sp.]